NNGGNYSPRWRDDPTDEASPLSRTNNTFFNNRLNNNSSNEQPISSSSPSTPKSNNNRVGTPILPASTPLKKLNFDNYEDSAILNDTSVIATIHTSEPVITIDLKTTSPLSKPTPSRSTTTSSSTTTTHLPPLLPYHSKIAGKLSNVPRFHFPSGKPISKAENDATLTKIEAIFLARPQQVLRPRDFDEVCRKMSLPVYTKRAVYEAVCQCSRLTASDNPDVTFNQFVAFWNE
uniref:Uncharacterized protein n=1 Tax=Panagrolaimus sp. ES5 TaxID=591445 RepID=A0AC34GDR5_9BILA